MDALDYVEGRSTATMAVLRKDYDDLHDRQHRMLALLCGGAGAAAAFALTKFAAAAPALAWAPIGALSLTWFAAAARLTLSGMRSRPIGGGNSGENLIAYFEARLAENYEPTRALEVLRRKELTLERERLHSYRDGCNARSDALDEAYVAAGMLAPLFTVVVAAVCLWSW